MRLGRLAIAGVLAASTAACSDGVKERVPLTEHQEQHGIIGQEENPFAHICDESIRLRMSTTFREWLSNNIASGNVVINREAKQVQFPKDGISVPYALNMEVNPGYGILEGVLQRDDGPSTPLVGDISTAFQVKMDELNGQWQQHPAVAKDGKQLNCYYNGAVVETLKKDDAE